MEDLNQRQIDILKSIIKEYTDSGEPVGSEILEKKYKLGVSPATIRNEMVDLTKKGYLKKNHFSSGRVPSAKGFRFFIQKLMKEKEMSTLDEVTYKNSIWDDRTEAHKLLSHATKILSKKTGLLSLATTNLNDVYYSGVANLLNQPEFFDLQLSRTLFGRLDEYHFWTRIMDDFDQIHEEIMFLLGEEDFRDPGLESCASIFGDFEGTKIKGMIGVIGPKRIIYEEIVPQVKYFSGLIGQIMKEQGM